MINIYMQQPHAFNNDIHDEHTHARVPMHFFQRKYSSSSSTIINTNNNNNSAGAIEQFLQRKYHCYDDSRQQQRSESIKIFRLPLRRDLPSVCECIKITMSYLLVSYNRCSWGITQRTVLFKLQFSTFVLHNHLLPLQPGVSLRFVYYSGLNPLLQSDRLQHNSHTDI